MMHGGIQRIVVMGAGALGSVLGAQLAGSVPVVLIGRRKHVEAIRARGLRLEGRSKRALPHGGALRAVTSLEELGAPLQSGDWVLLTVKAGQVEPAARALAAAAPRGERLPLAAFQNGTGWEPGLEAGLGGRFTWFHAVSHLGATLVEPGRVENWGGEILLPETPAARALGEALRAGGIGARSLADLERWRWKKIAFNCALNALSAILEVRNRETITEEWRPVRQGVLEEVRILARISGVDLGGSEALLAEFEQRALASNNVNSMWQDLQRGRPTEIGFLNEALARRALAHGEAAKLNALLAGQIRCLEAARDETRRGALRKEQRAALRALALAEAPR